jgi:DNA-directed RNA polymerase subunit N
MIIPVRCFSCGKPIGHLWQEYKTRVKKNGEDSKKVMDELGLKRYCCRAIFLGQQDTIKLVAKFKKS